MVKRKGYIIERIADMDNLLQADKDAQANKKINRHIRRHNLHQKEHLELLQYWILHPNLLPDIKYHKRQLDNDQGKVRTLGITDYFPWHILERAIINIIGPDIIKSLITDSCSCIPGKGLHFGVKRLKSMLRRYPEYKWFWKTDYKKFYESLPHQVVEMSLRRKYKDERLFILLNKTILSYDSGNIIQDLINKENEMLKRYYHRRMCITVNR